jgi:uncharacterized delta-60 repeat protein
MIARGTTLLAAGALCLAACGDDEQIDTADAPPPMIDAARADAEPPMPDADVFTPPAPVALPLSPAGPDQLQAAIVGPGGTFFYLAGFGATGVATTDPRNVLVIKMNADGTLDPAFGGGSGIAVTPFDFRGGGDEIDLVTQSDGKVLVSATVANLTNPADHDVVVARFGTDGVLDATFGNAGVVRLDLNTALDPGTGTLQGMDAARAIGVDGMNRIYVHAAQRGETPAGRTDTDFAVIRLDADGDPDNSYGDNSKFLLDITGGTPAASLAATPRAIRVLSDGSVLASGYTTNPSLSTGPQAVLYKLDPDGELDPAFATGGLFHDLVLSIQTEVYGFAVHGSSLVTGGYGRDSGDQNDWVSLRFDTTTGARDTTWGGAPNGAVVHDVSGAMVGDNCRGAAALPGGKTLLFGSTGPSNLPSQDAVFAVLAAGGTLDPDYGDGVHSFAFGGGTGGNDQLWGAAATADTALLVGYRGAGATQTTASNDDAYVILLPLR